MQTYIVDTNVILANPFFIKDLSNCKVLIPIYVFEELDKIKTFEGNTGFRARQFFRYFKDIEKKGNLFEGINLENEVILGTIIENNLKELPEFLDKNYVDNKILAIMLKEEYKDCFLLTNDVSMRLKASSLGIKAKLTDSSDKHKLNEMYDGVLEKEINEDKVKEFYENGFISLESLGIDFMYPNQFFIGYTNYSYNKIVGRYDSQKKTIVKLIYENAAPYGVTAQDIRQKFAFEVLLNPEIPFVTITSKQGCGKTLIAMAAALSQILENFTYSKMLIGKNTAPIDKWSYQGFTTGDTEEKLLTHFGNYSTTLENIQNIQGKRDKSGVEMLNALKNQNKLDILDISSILGSSFYNKIIIIDEAQSFDVHAMRSIITRIGKNTKLILIGDIGQQTVSRLDPDKSGLYVAVEWLKTLEETAHITLNKVHRGNFVEKASKIFDEKIFG